MEISEDYRCPKGRRPTQCAYFVFSACKPGAKVCSHNYYAVSHHMNLSKIESHEIPVKKV